MPCSIAWQHIGCLCGGLLHCLGIVDGEKFPVSPEYNPGIVMIFRPSVAVEGELCRLDTHDTMLLISPTKVQSGWFCGVDLRHLRKSSAVPLHIER